MKEKLLWLPTGAVKTDEEAIHPVSTQYSLLSQCHTSVNYPDISDIFCHSDSGSDVIKDMSVIKASLVCSVLLVYLLPVFLKGQKVKQQQFLSQFSNLSQKAFAEKNW